MPDKQHITERFKELQDSICSQLEGFDGKVFVEDAWERPGGGGGRSRVILGNKIEKGGVNFSAVHGALPARALDKLKVDQANFYATGVSIVLHPHNPLVPIIHMNVRYFELEGGKTWWFGGGIDLTPHYVDKKDAAYFHQQLKDTCDTYDASYYPKFKKWADDYFYLPHRKETRGVGGIFFDRLGAKEKLSKAELFDFVIAVGETFAPTYLAIAKANVEKTFTAEQKEWQGIRRGRYVEFNLVWDAGTKFGLETNGRTESILMSLPASANWQYNLQPAQGTAEAETLEQLKKGIDWLAFA